MCRISIIVPLLGDLEPFEDTLVSVLQNRPRDCEVLVVHRGSYQDPYELQDEVRFVEVDAGSGLIQTLNMGLDQSCGEIVHLLQAGVIVQEGWTDSVPARFAEDRCAAVAPLLLRAEDPQQIAAAGISYTAGGRRVLNDAGSPLREVRGLLPGEILGPALTAAFYRRRVIRSLGGFCEGAGEFYADVDLAMSLQSLGLRSFLEPRSIAWAPDASFPERRLSFTGGCQAERVFWRHDSLGGKPRSLLAHGSAVLGEVLSHCARPSALAHLLGRMAALADFSVRRRQQARLRQATESRDRRTRASADVEDADDVHDEPVATISLEDYRNRHAA